MKIFITLVLSIFIITAGIFNTAFSVKAQTYLDSPFDIQIFISDQNPETKVFRIKATVNSQIASDRNTIKWILPEGLQTTAGETEIIGYYCQLKEGVNDICNRKEGNQKDTFEFTLDVVPYKQVNGTLEFTIQSYIADGEKSYKVTQIAHLETNGLKELSPVSAQYNQLEQIINLRQLSTQSMIGVFGIFALLIIIRRVYIYVNPPIKSSLPHNSKILEALQQTPPKA